MPKYGRRVFIPETHVIWVSGPGPVAGSLLGCYLKAYIVCKKNDILITLNNDLAGVQSP